MADPSSARQELITLGDSRIANAYGHPKDTQIILERGLRAPMRDGVVLAVNLFRPAGEGRFPVLLHLAHLGKDRFPSDPIYARIQDTGTVRVSEWVGFESQDPLYWVPHGYVVIIADCRGTWDSEGTFFDHFSQQIARDFYDLVEWAAIQPWADGNVGSNGVSYLAIVQWLGAAQRPPHLKAMIPWEGSNDFYREWAFHGGIPDTGFYRIYMDRYAIRKGEGINAVGWRAAGAEDMIARQREHPLDDEFWKDRHPNLSRIDVPAYICASWSSDLHVRGSLEGWKEISSTEKWLEIHGRKEWEYYYARESLERQRRFMDCFLKGQNSGIREMPRVRFEVRDRFFEGEIRFSDDFPIPGTEYRKLYLDPVHKILANIPIETSGKLRYRATKTSTEPDCAELTVTFGTGIALVGYMKLRLWVCAEGANDMDLHVGIKKYDAHGNEVHFMDFDHLEKGMVAGGWLRVSHRELDETKSKPWQPWHKHERRQMLAEGEIVPVEIEILPSGTLFKRGEQLKLIIQGYDVLRYHYRHQHDETVNRGYHLIYAGGIYDSYLLIPVIPDRYIDRQ